MTNLTKALKPLMIQLAPAYANKLFYALGALSATSFIMLIISGTIMAINGPNWWLTNATGQYLRSVHMWCTQAFVLFVILHLAVVFFTSAYKKPRRLTWVIGVVMLLFVFLEAEFGFVLRGDFSSQWRALQGADFYNGSGLGYWLNALNYQQIYGIHVAAVPFLILALLAVHYLLVRFLGIAQPYRKDVPAKIVPANHPLLFARCGGLALLILIMAAILPSPYLAPITIQTVAGADPNILASTLVKELDGSSDTAGYKDNIAPYTYNTAQVYVTVPYGQLRHSNQTAATGADQAVIFGSQPTQVQTKQLNEAASFFDSWNGQTPIQTNNPVVAMIDQLVSSAKAGLYEPALSAANAQATPGNSTTYVLRLLSDSGVLESKASTLGLTTDQYGMLHEEGGYAPSAWWLAPIGILNHTVLSGDANGDRDAAIIFGSFFMLLIAFPFVPIVNQLPDKLKVYKLIWRTKPRSK